MTLDRGTCAFCGFGGGYLGEQGDETSQLLHSSVRSGEPGNWTYSTFSGADVAGLITWCGRCVSGLRHKWQRYDDTNLRALDMSYKVRMALDAPRWEFWDLAEEDMADQRKAVIEAGRWPDDQAIHRDKLAIEQELKDIQNELFRRAGFDLTTRDWRP